MKNKSRHSGKIPGNDPIVTKAELSPSDQVSFSSNLGKEKEISSPFDNSSSGPYDMC
jgi:hypothetical protein